MVRLVNYFPSLFTCQKHTNLKQLEEDVGLPTYQLWDLAAVVGMPVSKVSGCQHLHLASHRKLNI